MGLAGAKSSKRVKIPQVVGYIVIGVFLGSSFLNIVTLKIVDQFTLLSSLALAFIGFAIGGELAFRNIKELGRSIVVIALMESLTAFALVMGVLYFITGSLPVALIFGALAAATAPAATVDVLWEYRAKGPLTTSLFAVVGIDDGVALIIFGFASAIAKAILTQSEISAVSMVLLPLYAILGAVVLGAAIGFLLSQALRRTGSDADHLLLTLGAILLVSGAALQLGFSLILTNMILGVTLVNISKRREAFSAIARISPPFYLLFFILVGARLQISLIGELGLIGLAYIIFRTMGKSVGAWFGATISGAPTVVRKYLGFGLLSQAGVAIGLSIEAAQTFRDLGAPGLALALLAVNVIAGTTFIFQVLGPPLTRMAIFKAGEAGRKSA
ncbi:MAG TPA: cation:proton antiporter [Actinobacteria bacterium]|nr:cation:proton antiporter [Actinomycetota bacterium]